VNQPPTAVAIANPTSGTVPLMVNFDASTSSDPDSGDTLTYAWDLDGDGRFDNSTSVTSTYTYNTPGNYTVSLKVTDSQNASNTAVVEIRVHPPSDTNTPPTATILMPSADSRWKVDDVINFSGSATDQQDGTLPASALSWSVILHHCPSTCHTHPLQSFTNMAKGSFTTPDHEYPSYLEVKLTATDSGGLQDTKSIQLDPQTVKLNFQSTPTGLQLVVGGSSAATPFDYTVITCSNNSISAPSPQTLDEQTYMFVSWSDGGAQTHNTTACTSTTYTATYQSR